MTTTTITKPYRYQLPKKAIKGDCPQCGPRYRRTLSRYVDTKTSEPLPDSYGRCDRESNCGYSLSPYEKTATGMSYADEVRERNQLPPIPKKWFRIAGKWKRNGCTRASMISGFQESLIGATADEAERIARFIYDKPLLQPAQATQPTQVSRVCSIPDEVFQQSLSHYERNQFARLLDQQFGQTVATELLQRFQIGTSAHWPGACVFWYIDEQNRKRGGQIKSFGPDWHTEKYLDREGNKRSKTSWVHSALKRRLEKAGTPVPNWLVEYEEQADRSPCLFGLPQLRTAQADTPIAIVEAPKTAVICTQYLPGFIWLAIGAKSYLNAERLAPVRGRKLTLYPDLNAFSDWSRRADQLRTDGFQVTVSVYLESYASEEQKQAGLDLADYLLQQSPTVSRLAEQIDRPGSILKPDESQLERLIVEPCNTYPAELDEPNAPNAVTIIRLRNFFDWQRDNPPFNQLGIPSPKT